MGRALEPIEAALLAAGAYEVNSGNERELRAFMTNTLFTPLSGAKRTLKASVGGRIVRAAQDTFGVFAMGGGQYEGDAFFIFRGTTAANNKADYFTDGRVGLEPSKTGWPVHTGFNHAFTSMSQNFVAV